jgi:hypothetical protein
MSDANPLAFLKSLDVASASGAPLDFPVNAHLHVPPNFSSIPDVRDVVRRARAEGVRVLGISNYYGVDGYGAFVETCLRHGIFPLVGLEVIVFDEGLARKGWRTNDPQNPGKIYVCGKGLTRFPASPEARAIYAEISRLDNDRAREMLGKIAAHAAARGVPLDLDFDRIASRVAARFGVPPSAVVLQERYIAESVARALDAGPEDGRRDRWAKVLGGGKADAEIDAIAVARPPAPARRVQDTVRKYLMKVDRPGHVEERYVPLHKAFRLIVELGGILVYPVLADGADPVCEFEDGPEELADRVEAWGVRGVEFIPTRNTPEVLSRYAEVFDRRGFFMTAGTEHNSPDPEPITFGCKGGKPLPELPKRLFARGACVVAAHHYLRARGEPGLDPASKPDPATLSRLAALGARVIRKTIEEVREGAS